MPNAAGFRSLGDLFGLLTRRPYRMGMPHNVDSRHTLTSSLRCRCLQKPPPWQRLRSRLPTMRRELSPLIHQLKFSRRSEIASALSRILWRSYTLVAPPGCNYRIASSAFPLWQRRHWRRGFNQSDLLCQPLSRWLHCRWDSEAVTRTRATATQHLSSPATQTQPEKCLSS